VKAKLGAPNRKYMAYLLLIVCFGTQNIQKVVQRFEMNAKDVFIFLLGFFDR
jgi:hypothetical protein